jgi:hypothetical protein
MAAMVPPCFAGLVVLAALPVRVDSDSTCPSEKEVAQALGSFILFELEGLSGDEIAAVMRTNPGAVWVRLSRARRQFLERYRLWETKEEP